jgi:hypothetical protein
MRIVEQEDRMSSDPEWFKELQFMNNYVPSFKKVFM